MGRSGIWSALFAIAITAVVVSTAYLAAGALYDRMTPEEETPSTTVTLIAVATDGLGGASEHIHVPAVWSSSEEYDIGVRVVGLRSDSGVVVKFSLTRTGISPEDVNVFYYDTISSSWRSLDFQDQGNVLVATLGLSGGIAVYDGYDVVHRLIILSNIDGACQVKAWAESA